MSIMQDSQWVETRCHGSMRNNSTLSSDWVSSLEKEWQLDTLKSSWTSSAEKLSDELQQVDGGKNIVKRLSRTRLPGLSN